MPRDERSIPQLKPVDERPQHQSQVLRLQPQSQSGQSAEPSQRETPIKLEVANERRATQAKPAAPAAPAPQRRAGASRSHEPDVVDLLRNMPASIDTVEQPWGAPQARRPVPWGWFALIGLLMIAALLWSLRRMQEAKSKVHVVKQVAVQSSQSAHQEELEAMHTVQQLEDAIREFHDAASVEALIPHIRHPERVAPLVRKYYAGKEFLQPRLRSIRNLQPALSSFQGQFWSARVQLTDQLPKTIFLEITPQGAKVDWETAVNYQPIPWEELVSKRPRDTSFDLRVVAKPDVLFSHEFADSSRWDCYHLSVPNSVETLFGYVQKDSETGRQLAEFFAAQSAPQPVILRVNIPAQIQSPRGLVIDRFLSSRWIFIQSPEITP